MEKKMTKAAQKKAKRKKKNKKRNWNGFFESIIYSKGPYDNIYVYG